MDRLFFQQVYFSFEKTLQGIFQVKEIREVIIYVGLVKIDYQIYVALLIKEEFYKLKYCSTVVYMVPRA